MLQTQFSVQAGDLAESFRSTVGKLKVAPYGYAPDMTAPEGPSTGGGVQALQHLRLLPPEPAMPTIVIGHVNRRDNTAELRTFDHVEAICRERFKQGPPVDPTHYAQLLESVRAFLSAGGMQITLAGPPRELLRLEPTPSTAPPRNQAAVIAMVAGAIVLVGTLATALVWFFTK